MFSPPALEANGVGVVSFPDALHLYSPG